MITCPYCEDTKQQVKAGHTRSGNQRFQCQLCRRRYTPSPRDRGYRQETKAIAVNLYLEGKGVRYIGRILGLHHQSVTNWVNAFCERGLIDKSALRKRSHKDA